MKKAMLHSVAVMGICAFLTVAAVPVHAQDAAKALGGFLSGLIKNPPSQNTKPADLIGNLLQGNNAKPNEPNKADLVSMLSQSLDDIDEPREIELGRQLAAVLLGAKPLHPDMALQSYVNRLGRWISLQSSRPDLPWTFAVLDDAGYNAFAAPGGYVFVTKGLVDRVADESELAGILAHEITHVVAKHHLKALRKNAQAGLLSQVVASQVSNKLPAGLSSQLVGLGRNLYSKGLDQADELDADRNGVALAARAGLDPFGLVAVLQNLRSVPPDNPFFALSVSTHPPAQVRLDYLEWSMSHGLNKLASKPPALIEQRLARTDSR
jgi:predicted Zn-dependent protease